MSKSISSSQIGIQSFNEPSFTVVNEYDPLWPNDYQKVIQGMCIHSVEISRIYSPQCEIMKNSLCDVLTQNSVKSTFIIYFHEFFPIFAEMRGKDSKDDDASDSKKRRYTEEGRAKARERYNRDERGSSSGGSRSSGSGGNGNRSNDTPSGFGRRPRGDYSDDSDEDDRVGKHRHSSSRRSAGCKRFFQTFSDFFSYLNFPPNSP